MSAKKRITEAEWDEQLGPYELGFKHGNEIAMALGVSPSTVSRQLRRRGAVKGSRATETVKNLEALLDHKAMVRTRMEVMDSQRRLQASEALSEHVGKMVAALIAASEQGDITLANPVMEKMERMVGRRRQGRRRRR